MNFDIEPIDTAAVQLLKGADAVLDAEFEHSNLDTMQFLNALVVMWTGDRGCFA